MKKLFAVFSLPVLFIMGALFASAQTSTSTCIVLTQDLTVGATDATTNGQVSLLQNFLNDKGFFRFKTDNKTGVIVGLGTFGSQTVQGVTQFQRNYGITPTGYVGPLTRANIQTLTCAVGVSRDIVNQVVDTASTTNTSPHTLLTFDSPVKGDLIIKGEKDLSVDWTIASGATTTFSAGYARIKMDVIDTTGQVVGSLGNGVALSNSHGTHRVSGEFQRALKGTGSRNDDNIISNGVYKLRASLVYTPATPLCSATVTNHCVTAYSAADQALIASAATYGADSAWFYVVDPAPKPEIRISASSTELTVSAPITITWVATASSTNCTFTDVVASTTVAISPSGSKVVTPVASSSPYRVACDLVSVWPVPGMTYTTNAQKTIKISVGALPPTAPTATISDASGRTASGFLVSGTAANTSMVKIKITKASGNVAYESGYVLISNSGTYSKTITPSEHSFADGTYKVEIFPLLATTAAATKVVTLGSVCNSEQTSTATGCINLTKAFSCANGTVVQIPAALVVNDASRPQIEAQYCTSATGNPTVTGISPQAGGSATIVTLTGTNLANTTGVAFFATNGSHIGTAMPISKTNTTVTFKILGTAVPTPTTNTTYKVGIITSTCPEGCNSARPDYILVATAYYTFASGSGDAGKTACENSVQSTLGITRTCTQGGACGVNGQPPSTSNPSSSPSPAYGACIDPASIGDQNTSSAPVIALTNIGQGTVASGGTTTLNWSVTPTSGVTCAAASGSTVVGGNNVVPLSNTGWVTPPIYTTTTFGLQCTNAAGQSSIKTVTVTVTQSSTGTGPTVTLTNVGQSTVSSGGTTTLSWSVTPTDGTTCVSAEGVTPLNNGNPILLSGTWDTPPLYTATTYGIKCTNASGVTTKTVRVNVNTPTGTLAEPIFSATCSQDTRTNTYKIALKWNRVTGATNYPVRLKGPSFATNATQFNGSSVVGFNNPSAVDSPLPPTGTSYTFEGLTATGTYTYWGHAWTPSSTNSGGIWSSNTNRTVTCSDHRASSDDGSSLAVSGSPAVLGAEAMCVDLPYNMHRGAESPSVTNLQNFLIAKGYLRDSVTGFYGDKTVEAVKAYQGSRGLPQTGMVYDFTRQAIVADSCR